MEAQNCIRNTDHDLISSRDFIKSPNYKSKAPAPVLLDMINDPASVEYQYCQAESSDHTLLEEHFELLWHYGSALTPRTNILSSTLLDSPNTGRCSRNSSPRSSTRCTDSTHTLFYNTKRIANIGHYNNCSPLSAPMYRRQNSNSSSSSASSSASDSMDLSRQLLKKQHLHRVFCTFDHNGDGRVSGDDISTMFQKLGLKRSGSFKRSDVVDAQISSPTSTLDMEQFLELYNSGAEDSMAATSCSSSSEEEIDIRTDVDINHSFNCSAEEYADVINAEDDDAAEDEEQLVAAFQVFDKDGDGFISPEELQSVLLGLGLYDDYGVQDLQSCVDMIGRVDQNGDGLIDFSEFKQMFCNHPDLFQI